VTDSGRHSSLLRYGITTLKSFKTSIPALKSWRYESRGQQKI